MAKKIIRLEGFHHNSEIFIDFIEKEIPIKNWKKKYEELQAKSREYGHDRSKMPAGQFKKYAKEYKALNVKLHDEVVFYQDYAKSLLELYGTGNKKDKKKKAPDVSVDNLLGLMSKNKKIRERDMLGKTGKGITWKSEPRSRQAMQKFTNMMLKNDYKKMQYAATLLKQGEL
ncbi:MAG: hypothetical protein IIX87_04485, partial [Firmicutes bacterium]|nr:hypothetical protein [Bacillota bacterium]